MVLTLPSKLFAALLFKSIDAGGVLRHASLRVRSGIFDDGRRDGHRVGEKGSGKPVRIEELRRKLSNGIDKFLRREAYDLTKTTVSMWAP